MIMAMSRLAENFTPTRILGLKPRWKGLNDCEEAATPSCSFWKMTNKHTEGSYKMKALRDISRISSVNLVLVIYTLHLPSVFTLSVYHPHSVTSICWSLAVFCHCRIKGKVKSLSGSSSRRSCNNSRGALFSNQ